MSLKHFGFQRDGQRSKIELPVRLPGRLRKIDDDVQQISPLAKVCNLDKEIASAALSRIIAQAGDVS